MLGCKPGTADCRTFLPSNLSSASGPASCGTLTLDNTNIDTTGCTAQSCNGQLVPAGTPAYCLIAVDSLTVKQTVKVAGQYPLIIAATGPIQLTSGALLDASAGGPTPGPGGWSGGKPPAADQPQQGQGPGAGKHCTCQSDLYEDCGGGGAGHGATGGEGGTEATGCGTSTSSGGVTYDVQTGLVPLRGGSGGASGHNIGSSGYTLGAGGGGGGAIQLSSQQVVTIDGAISAGGGGGGGGASSGGQAAAAGGGGSGGAILIEAAKIVGSGWVAANGGGGGGGGENGSGGTGEAGRPDGTAAAGGNGINGGGSGGAGGVSGAGNPGGAAPVSYQGGAAAAAAGQA